MARVKRRLQGPEIMSRYVGESEAEVRRLFHRARGQAPCIVFLDEIDAMAAKRSFSSGGDGGTGSGTRRDVVCERRCPHMCVWLVGIAPSWKACEVAEPSCTVWCRCVRAGAVDTAE